MGIHYGVDYDLSVAAAGAKLDRWRDRCATLSSHKSCGTILDLGCSSGGFLAALKPSAWKLYGIDMSQAVADQARTATGADVFVGDILDAPFPPASFDAITGFHVLEHLYEPRAVLRKISEWLKPDGIFYMMVPNIASAGARIFRSYWYPLELPRHLFHFSPKSLRRLVGSVNLEEVMLTTNRELFVESSVRYVADDLLRQLGVQRSPLSQASQPGMPFRIVRKAFRMTVLPVLNSLASLAGEGESIHAIFRKVPSR
jgi:SAM-dependent methyltransferase